jgi:hypothetical protein
VVSFALTAHETSKLVRVRQAVPELAEVENICANLPANAALVVVGGLAQPYTMTVRSYCRVPVAQLPAPDPAAFAAIRKTAAAHGKTLMVLANAIKDLPSGSKVQPISTLTIEQWNTTLIGAAYASGHPVRSMFLAQVNPDGSVSSPAGQHVIP